MTLGGALNQLVQLLLVALAAPLLMGWVNACRAWLQNRSAPSLLQPYRVLRKLLHKDAALAENASWLFRFAPYVIFGCMWLVAGIVPVVATDLPFAAAAASEASPTGAWLLWLCLVDGQSPAIHLGAVQRCDRLLGLFSGGHFHKAEAARLPRKLVRDHADRLYGTVRCEQLVQLWLGCGKR